MIDAKTRKTQHEVKQEDAIKKRADKLTQSLIHKNMNPHEKMKSISSVKEQVEDIIMDLQSSRRNTPANPAVKTKPV